LHNGYTEKHHIIPKCLGGSDEQSNLVNLTPEEHYIAHQLLVKIYPNSDSLVYAACMMIPNRPNNKLYGWLRRKLSQSSTRRAVGSNNSQFGTKWISNIDLMQNKKIHKQSEIPVGWVIGRNKWISKKKKEKKLKEGNGFTRNQNVRIQKSKQKYLIENVIFVGLKPICEKYNLTHPAVIHRLKSDKFPDWLKMHG
jgi:hypothetical protein